MDTIDQTSIRRTTGYRCVCTFHELAQKKFAWARMRPASSVLTGLSGKKSAKQRKRLRRIVKRARKHPAVRLAKDPGLDVLDLSILYVLLRDAVYGAMDFWWRLTPTPIWILCSAGAPDIERAIAYIGRLDEDGALRKRGLVASHSGTDTPLVSRRFHPTPEAIALAFEDPDVCKAIESALPKAPKSDIRSDAPDELLVWPEDLSKQMDRVVHAAHSRQRVLAETGLLDRLPTSRGIHVLLQGPPGTGKTLAARALAARLSRPLRMLHGPDIQSMWVGEAEKAVREMYRCAQRDKVVLCVDEIDALIVNRDEARHSWERSLVDAFLVEMESFDGIAVYTTNRAASLDEALERRLTFRLEVPRPGPQERLRIWKSHLPETVPLAPDVDLTVLAEHDLSGGEILNAVLAAVTEASMREPLGVTAADLAAGVRVACASRWSNRGDPVGFGR